MSDYPHISSLDELIGSRVRHFRESTYANRKVTRAEFVEIINQKAIIIGIDYQLTLYQYRKYEDGINMPNELLLILKLLGLNMNALFDYSNELTFRLHHV